MKFLLLNTDYLDFQKDFYARNEGLDERPYADQMQVRMKTLFGTADFYSRNLIALGHEAQDHLINVEPLQRRWAHENGIAIQPPPLKFRMRRGVLPWLVRDRNAWLYEVLAAQIRAFRPDVLVSMSIGFFGSDFLRSVKDYYGVAIGQHASPMVKQDLSAYDLVLSSLPNLVDQFRKQGLKSQVLRLGFEPRVLESLEDRPKKYDVTFVGGVGGPHQQGTQLLEELSERQSVAIWGYGLENLRPTSPIHAMHHGAAWGVEMFQILRDSRIVFNRHIGVAGEYANNMRLFEGTGTGAMLLTDQKKNLAELFEPGRDVVTYESAGECLEKVDHYLKKDEERETIARNGQARTLGEHTYALRMQELAEIASGLLKHKKGT